MKRYLKIAASLVVIIGGAVTTTIISGRCGEIVSEKLTEWIDAD